MKLNVILTVHLDAFGLSSYGAVTVTDLDGDCHAIETVPLPADSTLTDAAALLAAKAKEVVSGLPEQLKLIAD